MSSTFYRKVFLTSIIIESASLVGELNDLITMRGMKRHSYQIWPISKYSVKSELSTYSYVQVYASFYFFNEYKMILIGFFIYLFVKYQFTSNFSAPTFWRHTDHDNCAESAQRKKYFSKTRNSNILYFLGDQTIWNFVLNKLRPVLADILLLHVLFKGQAGEGRRAFRP